VLARSYKPATRGRTSFVQVLAVALCLAGGVGPALGGGPAAQAPSDGAVKMAIVYNISKFVDWPAGQRSSGTLTLCVVGHGERLAEGMALVESRLVHGRVLHAQEVTRSVDMSACQIEFFADPLGPGAAELLAAANQHGVLTVSDDDGFLGQGGMVQLVNLDNHVRFAVNLGAAQKAGFSISSELLRLAERVVGGNAP
jgi:hypothetical protein